MKSKIKKDLKHKYMGYFLAVLLLSSASMTVSAAFDKVTAKLEVEQRVQGTDSKNAEFYYEMKPVDKVSPAPVQQKIAIKGSGKASFEIVFHEIGIYRYTLRQISEKKEDASGNTESYSVEIYVVRAEEADTLSATVLCYDEDGKKTDAVFEITCQPPKATPDSPKTGDDTGAFWGWGIADMAIGAFTLSALLILSKAEPG